MVPICTAKFGRNDEERIFLDVNDQYKEVRRKVNTLTWRAIYNCRVSTELICCVEGLAQAENTFPVSDLAEDSWSGSPRLL